MPACPKRIEGRHPQLQRKEISERIPGFLPAARQVFILFISHLELSSK